MGSQDASVLEAARAVRQARGIFIGAGAGMGVDSGLPDFRGNDGFWKAYPPFAALGLSFIDLANPDWFDDDPGLAWGFYGHRLGLYRRTEPHDGFAILHKWASGKRLGAYVFTSNVDGQFQKAGFPDGRVVECHGSIVHLQCTRPCSEEIWKATEDVDVDEMTFRARGALPVCRDCGGHARPNILMFGDGAWHVSRTWRQRRTMDKWIEQAEGHELVVIECGAGTAIPSVRSQCQRVANRFGAKLIRINPRESDGPPGTISLAMGALEALASIDAAV